MLLHFKDPSKHGLDSNIALNLFSRNHLIEGPDFRRSRLLKCTQDSWRQKNLGHFSELVVLLTWTDIYLVDLCIEINYLLSFQLNFDLIN